jgi:hypothetical protein
MEFTALMAVTAVLTALITSPELAIDCSALKDRTRQHATTS